MRFKVNCTISTNKKGSLIRENSILDAADLRDRLGWDAKRVEHELKEGRLVAVRDSSDDIKLQEVLGGQKPAKRGSKAAADKATPKKGPFCFTAKQLAGKSLDDLNVMIAGIDPDLGECETEDEAIAILGRDL